MKSNSVFFVPTVWYAKKNIFPAVSNSLKALFMIETVSHNLFGCPDRTKICSVQIGKSEPHPPDSSIWQAQQSRQNC